MVEHKTGAIRLGSTRPRAGLDIRIEQRLQVRAEKIGVGKSLVPETGNLRPGPGSGQKRNKRNKNNGDLGIKYFSNIEFTKTSQPHLHIQLFYSNLNPIKKAYEAVLCKNYKNDQSNSLCLAKDNSKNFNYVIKDYINFDLQLEQFKHHFRNVNFTTSSQKSISNSIVKYIYKNYKFKTKNRYKEILSAIDNKTIITKNNEA